MTLEVVITSGGTISKIDDVRHIGNFSKGTTGALIAEEFLKRGVIVHYIHNKEARRPFRNNLLIDPKKDFNDQIEKAKIAYEDFNKYTSYLHEQPFETFEEYYDIVKITLTENPIDVIVLAAAVSDYGIKPQEGKITSDLEVLQLELTRNPKVISLVKEWNPRIFQVGFKLLADVSLDELIDIAYKHGIKNHSNLTVANAIINADFNDRVNILITPEKGLIPVSLRELPSKIVDVVNQRVSKKHYKTEVNVNPNYLEQMQEQIDIFRTYTQRLWKLNLFEPYYENANMHFGFVATRTEDDGFLITSRGSNKKDIPLEDIVYVPKVDFNTRTSYVISRGKKASLNANTAAKIFEERPDVNIILHAHVFPRIENRTQVDYAPGTHEDVEETIKRLQNGEKIVEMINHGIIIVGSDLDGIIATLDIEPAYTRFPEFYDLIYKRFQNSTDFLDLVTRTIMVDEKILDLGAGTGDFSRQLLDNGYFNIHLADKNFGMIKVARDKLQRKLPIYAMSIENFSTNSLFDVIVVRQAINYLMNYERLISGLREIYMHLDSGGKLIFNAPNFREDSCYDDKYLEYDVEKYHVKIREMNLIEGRTITHTQHCILMKNDGTDIKKLYDLNKFGLFTKEEFERALQQTGFTSVKFFGKDLRGYKPESKTLYCIAKK